MNTYDKIDYTDYTLKQLHEARSGIDRSKYPNNAAQIDHYIKIKEGKIAEDCKPPERTIVEERITTVDSTTQTRQATAPYSQPQKDIVRFSPVDLPISTIFKDITGYFKSHKTQLFERLKYPSIGVLFTSYLLMLPPQEIKSISFWLATFLNLYILTVFTVKCHRIVLLDEHVKGIKKSLIWSKRETSFLLSEISIGVLSILPVIIILFLSVFFVSKLTDSKTLMLIYPGIVGGLGGYFFSRLVLILPAIATDQNTSFSAWDTSRMYVWKIFLFVVLVPSVISFIVTKGSVMLPYFFVVAPFLNLFVVLLAIISLSLIYKKITKTITT